MKNKGHLLLEVSIGFAVVAILLLAALSCVNTASKIKREASVEMKKAEVFYILAKEFDKNILYSDMVNFSEDKRYEIKDVLELNTLENFIDTEELEDMYFEVDNVTEESLDLFIGNSRSKNSNDKLVFRKYKCIG